MKNKTGNTLKALALFTATLVLGCNISTLAAEKESTIKIKQASVQPEPVQIAQKPTSTQWRTSIWEALPLECLQGSKPHPILSAYEQNEWKPFFVNSRFEPTEAALQLLQRLNKVHEDGLSSKPYQLEAIQRQMQQLETLRIALKSSDPNFHDAVADLSRPASHNDAPPSSAALPNAKYAMNTQGDTPTGSGGSQDMDEKYREAFRASSELDIRLAQDLVRFAQEMDLASREEQIKALTGEIPIGSFLSSLEPTSPHYKPLVAALIKYRQLSDKSEQVYVSGPALKMGSTGEQVRNLQRRLQQEDFYSGKISGVFDAATQEALKRFQQSHSLPADGAMGQTTRDWLNMPYGKKAQMVADVVKIVRQTPVRRADKYIRINIPQYLLEYYNEGKVQRVHRVIVGKSSGKKVNVNGRLVGENQTPPLASQIERIIINPRWYVTDRIRKELGDSVISDPKYVQMSSTFASGAPRLYQLPGPTNPLGRFKFEFPNAYAVFLHDTPKRQLFSNPRRDFSHGCVRVEKAEELATRLLEDDNNPAVKRIENFLASNRPSHVQLSESVPIVIDYLPVYTNGRGQLVFYGDPYGLYRESVAVKESKSS